MGETMIQRMAHTLVDTYPCLPREQRAADDPAMHDVIKAILAAMREPTEAVALAGMLDDFDATAYTIWPAMIDAILAEQP